ncbi:exportin-5-like [Watersipora subatra]|uniref:exportin-5-like n=1 Tax=Watersipora subatra TaxID=2589382 RepID=UPI00355B5DCC
MGGKGVLQIRAKGDGVIRRMGWAGGKGIGVEAPAGNMEENSLEATITNAVLCSVSPSASQQDRIEAYKVLEAFKATAMKHSQMLYRLLELGRDSRVKHYALHVIEHVIKQSWNSMPTDGKFRLKTLCVDNIAQVSESEPSYVAEGVARCTVEIVKREWPQQWPTFISEMSDLCQGNQPERTKLVMRILLRLAEDVVILNTLQPRRRKDVQTALHDQVSVIVPFLVQSLGSNMQSYRLGPSERVLQLITCTLETIMGYVSWCNAALVTSHNNRLITLLFEGLGEADLQLPCVECLLVIAQRHGNAEAISPVIVLFYEHFLDSLHQALLRSHPTDSDLGKHPFQKRLCQFTIAMGEQLLAFLSREGKGGRPPSFIKYLEILLLLTSHDSLFISSECFEFWATLMRVQTDSALRTRVTPELPALCLRKFCKVGCPSASDHASCLYSKLDFDSEADWLVTYHKTKSSICTLLQHMMTYSERELIDFIIDEIMRLHDLSIKTGAASLSDPSSQLSLQWQAASTFLHAVGKDMTLTSDVRCLSMIQLLLQSTTQNCDLIEMILSIFSALLPVVSSLSSDMFDILLNRIFEAIQYSDPTCTRERRTALARHAGAIFIRLATMHPKQLVPQFKTLHESTQRCRQNTDNRTFRYLLEGLLLVSNEMKNYSLQLEYIELVLENSIKKWNEPQLQQARKSALEMASYIGLLSPPDSDPIFNERRYQLQELFRDFLIVARRVVTPADPEVAAASGYLDKDGHQLSPSFNFLSHQMNSVMLCLNSTMGLFKREVMNEFHTSYSPSTLLELADCERSQIIGMTIEEDVNDGRHQSLQKHVLDVLDVINQLLVMMGKLSPTFYSRQLADMLSHIIIDNINEMGSFTLKGCIKSLLKPLCLNCPLSLTDAFVSPLLLTTLPPIVSRLDTSWQQLKALPELDDGDDRPDNEIIENELLRIASRTLLDTCLGLFLVAPEGKSKQKNSQVDGGDDVEMTDHSELSNAPSDSEAEVTALVKSLSQDAVLYLLWFATNCSCWPDSMVSQKSIDLVYPLVRYLLSTSSLRDDIAQQVLRSLLTSVHMHGHHDYVSVKLLTCVVNVYELFKRQFSDTVVNIMVQVPGVTEDKLKQYDHDTGLVLRPGSAPPKVAASAKKKREKLRALISEIVGRNVSEQFKENIVIKNLPPLVKKITNKSDLISEALDSDEAGLCNLFSPSC